MSSLEHPSEGVQPGLTVSDLVGRDTGLLGAGREGLAVRERLRSLAPEQAVTVYVESELTPELMARFAPEDRWITGPLDAARLTAHELLVRSPGVSPYRAPLVAARAAGVGFTTATNLWLAEHPGASTIAVTGTKGKSTTTALIRHLLCAAGQRAEAVGNIGVPLVACDPNAADWWVVELSSYQLCDLVESPTWGVLLNLSDEHLDWHGGGAPYRGDKLRLAGLVPRARLVANRADAGLAAALADRDDVAWFNEPGGFQVVDGALREAGQPLPGLPGAPGAHNLANLAAALTLLGRLDLPAFDRTAALAGFQGLPHRLFTLGERDGLRFVDDSLSTTPVATLAALEALRGVPVTVLVGGLDRGLDWAVHAPALRAAGPHALIGLPDSGSTVLGTLGAAGLAPPGGLHPVADMGEAVRLACALTPPGGVVLLSPGAPSFPRYRDYRERAGDFARHARATPGGENDA